MKTILLLLALTATAAAQLTVQGTIDRDATWSGIVHLNGDVLVQPGATLTIAPGTRVEVRARADGIGGGKNRERVELIVAGRLLAEGGPGKGRILFTSDGTEPRMGDWSGIVLRNPREGSRLTFCLIEYAHKGVSVLGGAPEIGDCEIRYNEYAGISCEVRARPRIINSNITANGFAGVVSELASAPVLERTIITQNEIGVAVFDRSEADLGRAAPEAGQSHGANYLFNNFESNIYNQSSRDVYAQNNLWNAGSSDDVLAAIVAANRNPAYGAVIVTPLFDSGFGGRERSTPAAGAGGPSRPAATQPVPLVTSTVAAPGGKTTPDTAPADEPVAVRPDDVPDPLPEAADTLSVADGGAAGPSEGETGAAAPTVEASFTEAASAPTGTDALRVQREQTGLAAIVEPVIEGLLDGRTRQYVSRAKPSYPAIYQRTRHEGKVLLEVVVGRDGTVESHRVLRSDGDLFTEEAVKALRRFRYKPGTVQGKPVRFTIVEPFIFRME